MSITACDDTVPTEPARDTVPPATSALALGDVTMTSIELTWTAPGDDGRTGIATAYDVRHAPAPVTASTWASATPVDGEPTPGAPGSPESFTITGLAPGTTYYVALRTQDEVGNWSAVSAAFAAATAPLPDVVAPAAVTDLAASLPTTVSLTLSWTAPGDDDASGTAAAYDLRRSSKPITEGTWDQALPVAAVAAPTAGGTAASCTVSGLGEATTWHFALRTRDEAGNWSALSNVADGTTDAFDIGTLVTVPAGTFAMGSPDDEPGRNAFEARHQVTLTRSFQVQARELTHRQYRDLAQWAYDHGALAVGPDGYRDQLDGGDTLLRIAAYAEIDFADGVFQCRFPNYPVWALTWFEAAACCDWLNLRLGLARTYDHATWRCTAGSPYASVGYRLPTEAEWECACRAGSADAFANGPLAHLGCSPVDANLEAMGWYCGSSAVGIPRQVGQKDPNAWGLYDMHGNVGELCYDWMGPYDGDAVDPMGVPAGGARCVRGGNANHASQACRSASRAWEDGTGFVGCRIARTAPPGGSR